jgi:hypothetical protein
VIWQQVIPLLVLAIWGSSNADRLIYDVATIMVGMAVFITLMAAEPYLRTGVRRRELRRRFVRVSVPLITVGVLGMLLQAGLLRP